MFHKHRKIMYMNWKNVQALWPLCLQLTSSCVRVSITYTSRDSQYHVLSIFFSAKIYCVWTKPTLPLHNYIIAKRCLLSNLTSKDAFGFCASNHCNFICLDMHTLELYSCIYLDLSFSFPTLHFQFPVSFFGQLIFRRQCWVISRHTDRSSKWQVTAQDTQKVKLWRTGTGERGSSITPATGQWPLHLHALPRWQGGRQNPCSKTSVCVCSMSVVKTVTLYSGLTIQEREREGERLQLYSSYRKKLYLEQTGY